MIFVKFIISTLQLAETLQKLVKNIRNRFWISWPFAFFWNRLSLLHYFLAETKIEIKDIQNLFPTLFLS